MNLDGITQLPTSLDLLHLILAVVSGVSLISLFRRGGEQSPRVVENSEAAATPEVTMPAPSPSFTSATPDAALQLLSLLQQDARFVDFVLEDLSTYSDEEVGGVARVVHDSSQKTLSQYFSFEHIRAESEEASITVPAGFDAAEIRLTGNVVGEAPFSGMLVHKGWRVTNVALPKTVEGHDTAVIAPAEVEL